jgi:hypothetical protein
MPVLQALYVLADGARARLVHRAPETGAFVTFEELAGEPSKPPSTGPVGRSFESGSPARHALRREGFDRPAKDAFIAGVARRAAEVCAAKGVTRVWIAAPPRLTASLREPLSAAGLEVVVIRKDLTKTPDHALGRWLGHLAPT